MHNRIVFVPSIISAFLCFDVKLCLQVLVKYGKSLVFKFEQMDKRFHFKMQSWVISVRFLANGMAIL